MCDVVFNAPVLDQCRQRVESELVMCKADLAPLESGELRIGERMRDGPWIDITEVTIAGYKRSIETLQRV
jgi:hypothetical protein